MKRYLENNFLSPLFEKIRVLRSSIEQQEKQHFTSQKEGDKTPSYSLERKKKESMMPNFIVLDTETTGLDSYTHSLLDIPGVSWNPLTGEKKVLFSFFVNEDIKDMIVDPEAMKVNRIDLDEVQYKGLLPKQSVQEIEKSLQEHYGKDFTPPVIIAQNAHFDLGFTKRLYKLAGMNIEKHFQRRVLDVPGVLYWLMLTGKMDTQYPNFNNLLKETDVHLSPNLAHTAKADAVALAEAIDRLYKKFREK
jgi:DNA polymerase III epsilon subunit-like protein